MGRKLKRKTNKRQIKQIFERQTRGNGKENEKKKGQGEIKKRQVYLLTHSMVQSPF